MVPPLDQPFFSPGHEKIQTAAVLALASGLDEQNAS
jgi:hypothetical protein